MIKKFLSMTAIALIMLLAYGCDDDKPTEPTKSEPKFQFPIGSYWIYDNYELDEANSRNLDSKITDSVVISGTKQLFGKTATIFSHYVDGNVSDTYYAADSNKLYATSDLINPGITDVLPLNIPVDTWFLIADYDQNEWVLFTQDFKDQTVTVGSYTAKITGTFKISCKRVPSQTAKWGSDESKTLDATNFQLIYSFAGQATVLISTVDLNFDIINNIYHNPTEGLIKTKRDTKKISITLLNQNFELRTINGMEDVLLRYKINK
jgi:hypothetical protein